jgi:hypothetical protein
MSTPEKRLITLKESDALRAMPGLNPQALIAAAIDKGASIETLERLVQLAKDIRAITAKEAYNKAIAEFQRRCPPIKKNRAMVVQGRPTYRYGDLGEIIATISPLMGELGLSKSWEAVHASKPNHVASVCIISHELGHSERSGPTEIPYGTDGNRMNAAQSVGSAKTYAKRYSLCDALGISPEDDDDATGTNGSEARTAPRVKPSVRQYMAETEPDQPPAPDDPALVTESQILLPTPDEAEERAALMTKGQQIIKERKLSVKAVKAVKQALLDDENADMLTIDLASLAAVVRHLEVAKP